MYKDIFTVNVRLKKNSLKCIAILTKSCRVIVDWIGHLPVFAQVWHLGNLEEQNEAEKTGRMKASLVLWLAKIQAVIMAHSSDTSRENMEREKKDLKTKY